MSRNPRWEASRDMWVAPLAATAVVCAVHVTTLWSLPPSVFWSPDEGAKFIQMHSRLTDAGAPHRIAYGAAAADPFFVFYPRAIIYPRPLWPSGVRRHWPELFPALSLPFFLVLSAKGLYLIPLAGGILTAALAAKLAQRMAPAAAAPAALIAGLASPVFFHSMLFLEHSLACVFGLGALILGWNAAHGAGRARSTRAAGAIACLAFFFVLRDEAMIFTAALAFAGILTMTTGRRRVAVLVGCPLAMLSASVLLVWMSGILGAGRWTHLAENSLAALSGLWDAERWRVLPQHALHVLVNNPEQSGVPLPPGWSAAGLVGLFLCGIARQLVPRWRFACWMVGGGLVAATGALGLCLPDRYRAIHGLLLAMPGLVLAGFPPCGNIQVGRGERLLATLLPAMLALHVATTWLLRRPTGGAEWGGRYAMMVYVLAAVLGAVATARFAQANGYGRRFAGLTLAFLLFAISCGYGIRGVFELQVTKRDLQAFEREVERDAGPIVTDCWWLAAALAPIFVRAEFYTLHSGQDLNLWLERMGPRVRSFLYVSYEVPPDAIRAAGAMAASVVQRRTVQAMTFSTFTVRGDPL